MRHSASMSNCIICLLRCVCYPKKLLSRLESGNLDMYGTIGAWKKLYTGSKWASYHWELSSSKLWHQQKLEFVTAVSSRTCVVYYSPDRFICIFSALKLWYPTQFAKFATRSKAGGYGENKQSFNFQAISRNCIARKLLINLSKATGYDNIPPKLLRLPQNELPHPIPNNMNNIMATSSFPGQLKCAELSPL